MSIKVGVLGAKGRMGSETVAAIKKASDLEWVASLDLGDDLAQLNSLGEKRPSVLVDFTTPDAVMGNIEFAIKNKINLIVGTTGFNEERLNQIRNWLGGSPQIGVLVAPNFGLGAVLSMKFAEMAATHFESVEIIELHHPDKVDAPSGTARATAEIIGKVRSEAHLPAAPDATRVGDEGARGDKIAGIPIHSVRVRGLVAHQEIIFGEQGETLTIRHDSIDRSGFMPGVLLGIRKIGQSPGLTYGLDKFLFGGK
jgi:4-hydroxy-tetrahydrodipicolinate reductase